MTLPTLLAAETLSHAVDPRSIQQGLLWIPLVPMLAALFNALFGWRIGKNNSALIACGAVGVSFVLSVLAFLTVFPDPGRVLYQQVYTWFATGRDVTGGGIHIDLAYAVDRFSSIMLLIITGVGFLIHVYSISYMSEELPKNFARYFAYLNLFVGMMLTLVMGANLVVLFVGWEGVGLASYLLIGFWWDDEQKAAAGRKAFVVNRIGDFGFLIGMFVLLSTTGTLDLYKGDMSLPDPGANIVQPILGAVHNAKMEGERQPATPDTASPFSRSRVKTGPFQGATWLFVFTLASLLLFLGATGKSAQLPLYVWLPDAMAGPTPVSALIHAATMVTAGVYMLCRLNYLVATAPVAMIVIAFVGACTALFAAIIGTQQNDIKKVLAYSTVSQLGYMIMGAGIGAYWAASLHLLTHAFFKACLFLGAGAVMHAMANETNIWKLGGLRKDIPQTAYTFLIATIAITGVIPLSGYFSKDAILDVAVHSYWGEGSGWIAWALWIIGTLGAFCTAFYMFRAYFLTFEGERRSLKDHHAHEAPLMTVPLMILAALSILAAIWGIPFVTAHNGEHVTLWQEYLNPVFVNGQNFITERLPRGEGVESGFPWMWWLIALGVAWAGAGVAYWKYVLQPIPKTNLAAEQPVGNPLQELVRHKFYVDELYDYFPVGFVKWLAFNLWKFVDRLLIDTVLVGGWAFLTSVFAGMLRTFQNGSAQRYAAVMAIALVVILFATPARDFLAHFFAH